MRFAMRGGEALRSGEWKPSTSDPVFLAYLALLREESGAFYHALTAVVEVGEPIAPILAGLLNHENHEPRKLVRIISVVRPDKGRILYEDFRRDRPEVQRALEGALFARVCRRCRTPTAAMRSPCFSSRSARCAKRSRRRSASRSVRSLSSESRTCR